MMPLYGFLEGDTVGLLILSEEGETVASLAAKLQEAAAVRVAPREGVRLLVIHEGRELEPQQTLSAAGIHPLDRFDVRPAKEAR